MKKKFATVTFFVGFEFKLFFSEKKLKKLQKKFMIFVQKLSLKIPLKS